MSTSATSKSSESKRLGFLNGKSAKLQYVGAKNVPPCGNYPYIGPTARIEYDNVWLHIITDDYEGHAMLNIEALPHLRRALARISKAIKSDERAK